MLQHRELQEWVDQMARMCCPDHVVWIDGSAEEKDRPTLKGKEERCAEGL